LIGHTFDGFVVGTGPYDLQKVIQNHQSNGRTVWFWSNKSTSPQVEVFSHVLAPELPQLSK
jgi:hypothetical protein